VNIFHFLPKKVIPKSDRPSFDQFTYEEIYSYKATSSSICSVSQQKTIDSGIGYVFYKTLSVTSNNAFSINLLSKVFYYFMMGL